MSSRVEELLAAAVDGSGTDGLDPPQSRNEKLLFALNNKLYNVQSELTGKVDVPADGQAYQQLVTDGDGNTKWEDRLAYEYTVRKDFVLNTSGIPIDGFVMPPIGDTVTVKVNGVESVETVKSGEFDGFSYSYIGSIDMAELASGANGWLVMHGSGERTIAIANPETIVSLLVTKQHKIDEKYIQQDKNFVRPLSYFTGDNYTLYKTYYKESGDYVNTYKCNNIVMPKTGTALVTDRGDIGIGRISRIGSFSFWVQLYSFADDVMNQRNQIYGTDETDIAEFAAICGYTLTTKPTT